MKRNTKIDIKRLIDMNTPKKEISELLGISIQYINRVLKETSVIAPVNEISLLKEEIAKLKIEVNPYISINRKEFMDRLKEDAIEEVGEHVNWKLDKVINTYIRKALKKLIREQIAELMEERGIIEPRSG